MQIRFRSSSITWRSLSKPSGRCLIVRRPLSRWEFLLFLGVGEEKNTHTHSSISITTRHQRSGSFLRWAMWFFLNLMYVLWWSKRRLDGFMALFMAQSVFIKFQSWRKVGVQTVMSAAASGGGEDTESPKNCLFWERTTFFFFSWMIKTRFSNWSEI